MAAPEVPYTDRYWTAGHTRLEVPVQVNVTDFSKGYFYAHYFYFTGNVGNGAYIGLQTVMNSVGGGPGAIFSIWDSLECQGPIYAASFGGEGVGHSVRIPFAWTTGVTFTLKVELLRAHGRFHRQRWWAGFVNDQFIGHIRTENGWGNLTGNNIQFTEYYSAAATCGDIPASEVIWAQPSSGGVAPNSSGVRLAGSGCPGSTCEDLGSGISRQRTRWS